MRRVLLFGVVACALLAGGAAPSPPQLGGLLPETRVLGAGDVLPPDRLARAFDAEAMAEAECRKLGGSDCDRLQGSRLLKSGALRNLMQDLRRPDDLPYAVPTVSSPFLPWPPPQPSARTEIATRSLAEAASPQGLRLGSTAAARKATPTYTDIDRNLRRRLRPHGYEVGSYFWTPVGFALLTPLERIDDQAVPIKERRWIRQKDTARWSLADFTRKLFVGDDGRYRMLLFLVTEGPLGVATFSATQQDVERWEKTGDTGLSKEMLSRPVTADTRLTVLAYEFRLTNGRLRELRANTSDALPVGLHLKGLGL